MSGGIVDDDELDLTKWRITFQNSRLLLLDDSVKLLSMLL